MHCTTFFATNTQHRGLTVQEMCRPIYLCHNWGKSMIAVYRSITVLSGTRVIINVCIALASMDVGEWF